MAKPVHLDIVTGVAARVELFNEPPSNEPRQQPDSTGPCL